MSWESKTKPSSCPDCGTVVDAARSVGGEARPEGGDWTVCGHCGVWLVFTGYLGVRRPTDRELAGLPQEVFDLLAAATRLIKKIPEEVRFPKG